MDLRSAEIIGRLSQALRDIATLDGVYLITASRIAKAALNSVGIPLDTNEPQFFTEEDNVNRR